MTSYVLSGRKALVTGGAQGLGEGMAKALAAAGAKVVIGDLQDSGAETAAALGDGHGFVKLDVTDDASWAAAVQSTISQLGGFDLLVNNAGIEITSLITEVKAEDVSKMLAVNVLGTTLGIKHGLLAMRPGGAAGQGGTITNIASVAATIAFPAISVYSATKSAVDRLTRVAAMESGKLGYGVRVNWVCTPAWCRPQWVPAWLRMWPRSACSPVLRPPSVPVDHAFAGDLIQRLLDGLTTQRFTSRIAIDRVIAQQLRPPA